jgi:two-component system, OmpR family, response regulator
MRDEPKHKILCVDDDGDQLDLVSRILRVHGFEVMTCASPIGVSNVVRSFRPDIVLVDVNMPALSGDRTIEVVRRLVHGRAKFVLYSACDETTLRGLARQVEADGWISKSVTGLDLVNRLNGLCAQQSPTRA